MYMVYISHVDQILNKFLILQNDSSLMDNWKGNEKINEIPWYTESNMQWEK